VVQYLAVKIVNRIIKSPEKYSEYRLAHYVKIQMAEILFPGQSLNFEHIPSDMDLKIRCGNKGAQMLESLETVFGSDSVLKKIKLLLREHSYHTFSIESFLSLLRFQIVDDVDLAQVYILNFNFKCFLDLRVLVSKCRNRKLES
jgi:hypothetical protein